jgi:hypothetical protein
MASISTLKVVPFKTQHISNPYPRGDLPWQLYHTVRNAVVRTCRKYGPTGPRGVVRIANDVADPYRQVFVERGFWERGDPDADYLIVDDQYNNERYLYAELYGDDPFNASWLADITTTLREYDGWGLGLKNLDNSYILIFGDRLMVNGPSLSRCKDSGSVVAVVRQLLARE